MPISIYRKSAIRGKTRPHKCNWTSTTRQCIASNSSTSTTLNWEWRMELQATAMAMTSRLIRCPMVGRSNMTILTHPSSKTTWTPMTACNSMRCATISMGRSPVRSNLTMTQWPFPPLRPRWTHCRLIRLCLALACLILTNWLTCTLARQQQDRARHTLDYIGVLSVHRHLKKKATWLPPLLTCWSHPRPHCFRQTRPDCLQSPPPRQNQRSPQLRWQALVGHSILTLR